MSTHHDEAVILRPVDEVAKFLKNLIPPDIPGTFALKPVLKKISGEENIRNGVAAFRNFLNIFCDRLISDGQSWVKPPKIPAGIAQYPFINNITNLLMEIGYYGKLSKDGHSLLITELPSCIVSAGRNGNRNNAKISSSDLNLCLKFLSLCGFVFNGSGIEAKTYMVSGKQLPDVSFPMNVSYPDDPVLPVGLKALSVAEAELRETRRFRNDINFLRCDYRPMIAGEMDMLDVLRDFLHPLPVKIQKTAIKLHQRYIDMGMTCVMTIPGEVNLSYSYIENSRRAMSVKDIYYLRIWEFSCSLRFGYCLVIRAKKTDKYADVIKKFPLSMQKLIERGYGCDRKLRNERCQHGCHGFRIPLDDSILKISDCIEQWLDNEVSFYIPR